ncbi:hypothetical protein VIN01S_31640 [Vibrio inusitatus NBRC 102082]|uniref:Uncharacterized protein n=1 Tax=Vibrio inusitatus NBRC 102082 TaxID=1219070 RepID=A0A4Y3I047_9VIBR|nr:hypothetical protein VIN01S_31640 [Vibrio inusitatus NBRC 102082]
MGKPNAVTTLIALYTKPPNITATKAINEAVLAFTFDSLLTWATVSKPMNAQGANEIIFITEFMSKLP